MKKLIAIILTVVMIFCFAGCGNSQSSKTSEFDNIDWDKLGEEAGYPQEISNETLEEMDSLKGENKEISGNFDSSLAMQFTNGTFVGTCSEDVLSLKGVPYAVQPTGKYRWKKVGLAEASDKVYEAKYFGHSSIQPEDFQEYASLYTQGEDCLNLNIWKNTKDNSKDKPIMVFFHGGAYVWGGSSDPQYEGTDFIRDNGDVILITVNYRLGILGFANFEKVDGGEDYPDTANLGIQDQITALKWIRKNAEAMGGDKNNITIFGESAGGGSVAALLASPKTKGLFQHVMAQSGNCSSFFRSKETSQRHTDIIMGAGEAENMDDLMALNQDQIRDLEFKLYIYTFEYTCPEPDDVVLPKDCLASISENNAAVDFMTGTTKDEVKAWAVDYGGYDNLTSFLKQSYKGNVKNMTDQQKAAAKALKKATASEGDGAFELEFSNSTRFYMPAREEALTHAKAGGNSYVYWFTEEDGSKLGACHASDLRYTFNKPDDHEYSDKAADPYLSKVMQRFWVNFAKTGDPSIPAGEIPGSGAIKWEKYNKDTHQVMILNSDGCNQQSDPLWEKYNIMKPFVGFERKVSK